MLRYFKQSTSLEFSDQYFLVSFITKKSFFPDLITLSVFQGESKHWLFSTFRPLQSFTTSSPLRKIIPFYISLSNILRAQSPSLLKAQAQKIGKYSEKGVLYMHWMAAENRAMCERQQQTEHSHKGIGMSREDSGEYSDGHLYFTLATRHWNVPQRHGDKYWKTQNVII